MTKSEFWLEYANYIGNGIFWLFICSVIYFIIYRKYIYSILDPLALHIIMSASASSVVLFLFQISLIKEYYFYSFMFTQLSFVAGFMLTKPISYRTLIKENNKSTLIYDVSTKYLYLLSLILYLFSILTTYYINGIPLFMESRLEAFSGGSGFGIFGRIIPITTIIILSIAFYNIFFIKKRTYIVDKFVILTVIINAIFSGSKSEILYIFFVLFFVIFFNYQSSSDKIIVIKKRFERLKWYLLLFSIVVVLLIINIQVSLKYGADNTMNPLFVLLMRLINSGDIFFEVYPNDYINYASTANGLEALFSPILGTFRLMTWGELPDSIGLQIHQMLYQTDLIEGPNTRHNIFGLFYFGPYVSIIFSFILGYLISYFRNKFYFKVRKSLNGMIVYILIAINILAFEVDPVMTVSNLTSIVIIFIPLYFISKVLKYNQNKQKEDYVRY
jgi:oligosaccharide repeat unit polymerase